MIQEKHKIKLTTLILSGVGAVIGSGWLFGSANAASLAGPAAVLSWIIGAIMVLAIALNLAEIASIAPSRMGGIGYYLRYTHGTLPSFIAEWILVLGFISTVPSEATASTQYLSSWNFDWAHNLFNTQANSLTTSGLIVSSLLCMVYFIINYFSLSLLEKSIKAITIFKILVPIIAIIGFISTRCDMHNLYAVGNHSLTPYGISGIFTAVTTAGIVFAFNGFQAPIAFAAEARNPKRDIPIALIASVLICTLIYVAIQFSYIISMPAKPLQQYGWNHLNMASPFAQLAMALDLNLIALIIYFDAFISPSGAGIIYTSISARIFSGMHEHMPKTLTKIDQRTGLPRAALIVILLTSFLALWVLPSWDKLAAVISVGYVLCYTTIPICCASLRKLHPQHPESAIRLPGMKLLAPISFILATLMLYWSRWPLNGEIIFVVLVGLPIYLYYAKKRNEDLWKNIKSSIWLIAYLITVAIFSYLGSNTFGGINIIPDKIDSVVLALISLIFFYWGVNMSYKTPEYKSEIEKIKL